jgi:carbonic anhydrase
MDPRLDPLGMLGLELGDAAVLRNAGARATDEVMDALALGQKALGVDKVVVVIHTDCRAQPVVERQEAFLRDDVRRIQAGLGVDVEAFRFDVVAGTLSPAG